MRLCSAIFLLSILLLNLFGFYTAFFVSRECVKTDIAGQMKALSQNLLEQFEFTVNDYYQLTRPDGGDGELIINGAMYDVKGTEIKAGKVIVYAKKDMAELNLINNFLSVLHNNSSPKTGDTNLLIKIMQQDFVWTESNSLKLITENAQPAYFPQNFALISRVGDLASPPPDYC